MIPVSLALAQTTLPPGFSLEGIAVLSAIAAGIVVMIIFIVGLWRQGRKR
jgi:hypothetical protein